MFITKFNKVCNLLLFRREKADTQPTDPHGPHTSVPKISFPYSPQDYESGVDLGTVHSYSLMKNQPENLQSGAGEALNFHNLNDNNNHKDEEREIKRKTKEEKRQLRQQKKIERKTLKEQEKLQQQQEKKNHKVFYQ